MTSSQPERPEANDATTPAPASVDEAPVVQTQAPNQRVPTQPADTASSKRWHDLSLVLLGAFLSTVGGVVAHRVQAADQREQMGAEVRIKEQEVAAAALMEIGEHVDEPFARALLLFDAIVHNAPDSSLRRLGGAYSRDLESWRVFSNRARLLASIYFGDSSGSYVDTLSALLLSAEQQVALAGRLHVDAHLARRRLAEVRDRQEPLAIRLRTTLREQLTAIAQFDSSAREVLRLTQERAFVIQRSWAGQIQVRRTGSFDPLARYLISPGDERRLQEGLAKAERRADSSRARSQDAVPPN